MEAIDEVVHKAFVRGTHRSAAPERTLERVRRLMPALGITRVADVTGLDSIGIPVAMAYRPNSRSLVVSPGKGLDLIAAKTSALMESLEGWHAERVVAPLLLASYNELRFERRVVDIARLPRRASGELHEDTRLLWIEGLDLIAGKSAWLPFEVVHTNYTLPLPASSGALVASSNGLASGNHALEAVCHAICELIERDATTVWLARGAANRDATRLDLDSVDDPACREILERFERATVKVGVWDITSDVGVAAFRCVIADSGTAILRPHLPGVGAGCHPSRSVALLRALTEAAQTRLTLISGTRDDLGVAQFVRAADPETHERTLRLLAPRATLRRFGEVPDFAGETFNQDLEHLVSSLARVGIQEVLALDLGKPKLGIPVFRVVIPGLEGVHEATGYLGGARYRRARTESGN